MAYELEREREAHARTKAILRRALGSLREVTRSAPAPSFVAELERAMFANEKREREDPGALERTARITWDVAPGVAPGVVLKAEDWRGSVGASFPVDKFQRDGSEAQRLEDFRGLVDFRLTRERAERVGEILERAILDDQRGRERAEIDHAAAIVKSWCAAHCAGACPVAEVALGFVLLFADVEGFDAGAFLTSCDLSDQFVAKYRERAATLDGDISATALSLVRELRQMIDELTAKRADGSEAAT